MKTFLLLLALVPLLPGKWHSRDKSHSASSTTRPSTATTQPTAHGAVVKVHRGSLTTAVDATGYFEPVDPLEVRIRAKAYGGELAITSAVSNGASVKKGDLLLEIDPVTIDKQIAAAEGEDAVAHANLTRAEADAKIGQEQDALAMKMQTDSTKQADDAVKWFETVDGPNELATVDLILKDARASVEDQQDELDELKKMYKSDDLTTDTADIVVKRSVRRLEMSRQLLKMEEERANKIRTYIYPAQKQRVYDAAKQADELLEALKAAEEQTKVVRETGLKAARAAAESVDERLKDLKSDRQKLTVRAPEDGQVVYGQFAGGGFNPMDTRTLRIGERIAPQQIYMTFYTPGKLRLKLELPEQKFVALHAGTKVTLTPASFPEQKMTGTCDACTAAPVNTQQGPLYPTTITCPDVDARIVPGMRANLHADAVQAENVLLVPNAAIKDGSVWVKTHDGTSEKRQVTAGKTDGKQTEIKKGLEEGDEIFTEAQK